MIFSWPELIKIESQKQYFISIQSYLNDCDSNGTIYYPERKNILKAFQLCPLSKVKVVIIGQDPYHNPNQADGLAFSVSSNSAKLPPSLVNIFKEVRRDCNLSDTYELNSDLSRWSMQGVFLLNSILTVEKRKPSSHGHLGWQQFTAQVLKVINNLNRPVIFLCWGAYAYNLIKSLHIHSRHFVLHTSHPSPLSYQKGFMKCNHFYITNSILDYLNADQISWI